MEDEIEKVIYRGGPSQWLNFRVYFVCMLLFLVAVFSKQIWANFLQVDYAQYKDYYKIASKVLFFAPVAYALMEWMKLSSHKYIITTERLKEEEGLLSKHTHELELFRVKDMSFNQPFLLRMFGCGNIILDTSDKSTPVVVMQAIKNGQSVLEMLRKNVQNMRAKKGVREIDS
jgi:uncharacterized membrane protein YdbT with pleckstrin-like domain